MDDDFRDRAAALDAADPMGPYRQRFAIDDELVAYLDGNSLGRLPLATRDRWESFVRDGWGGRLIRGWSEGWSDLPVTVGDEVGALLGAAPGQTVVGDSTSVCLAKALHAAVGLRPGRDRLVVSRDDFPTDRYLARSVADAHGLEVVGMRPQPDGALSNDEVAASFDERTAVVLLSHVDYRTGALLDLQSLTARAHAVGAVVVWDLCHSAGVVPIELDALQVDLAVGCTYKYLNAGPGAPAFLYAAARHLPGLRQPMPGWWSASDVFAMAEDHVPAPDARRLLTGTPNVAGLLAVREGVALAAEAGVAEARTKSGRLTAYCLDALDTMAEAGALLEVVTPRHPWHRGSHITIRVEDAHDVHARLLERGVVADVREPGLVRLGLAPITTSYGELHDAMVVLEEVLGV